MLRIHYRPAARLAAPASAEEFLLPDDPLTSHVTKFDLVWIHYGGETMPAIHHPELHYPGHRPATPAEIAAYRAARLAMRAAGKTYISKYE